MNIDGAAGFAILAFGLATALSFAPAAVVKAQVILQPDSLQSGATTPKKLNDQIREGAKTQQARGTAAARYGVYTIAWPKDAAERDELVRVHPPVHWMVPSGRPQVLGDRQQVDADRAQVRHRRRDLLAGLAHAEDQVGLRDQAVLVRLAEHVE